MRAKNSLKIWLGYSLPVKLKVIVPLTRAQNWKQTQGLTQKADSGSQLAIKVACLLLSILTFFCARFCVEGEKVVIPQAVE